ncbi:hypothetical protein F4604DRAFT_1919156 [Suillus subluteus]|nr:hypothetical protein F4604DRAFT_1919156 [Suillus subluteus]
MTVTFQADATQCPGQFGDVDELPSTFFDHMETDDDSSPMGGAHPHSSANPLLARFSSFLCRFQPDNGEMTELPQCPSHPHIVEVAAVWDRQTLVVAQGPKFEKAKRAYEQQTQSHSQAQVLSSHTQLASTPMIPPAPGATTACVATTQSPPITWWAQTVLFLCCASPPHANGY